MSPDSTPSRLRLVAVTRKPGSPSFEQRILRYIEPLAQRGIDIETRVLPKRQLAQRRCVRALGGFDGVWWHRHLLSSWWVGALRGSARRLVMDFDDPVIFSSRHGGRRSLSRRLRFAHLLHRCDALTVASDALRTLALPYCSRVVVVPMAVEAPRAPAPRSESAGRTLLWIGSPPTQPYLERIRPALEALGRRHLDLTLRLVAHAPMRFDSLTVDFRRWSPAEQQLALEECDIGLCPMPDTLWTRGKCPFKVLQYMANGMAWVGSPVGELLVMAGDRPEDARGLCPDGETGWVEAIERLAGDAGLRLAMGRRGHAYVREHHDRATLADRLAAFWRGVGVRR
jgi:glycosyltransferase involved in cell wall biosynthesis